MIRFEVRDMRTLEPISKLPLVLSSIYPSKRIVTDDSGLASVTLLRSNKTSVNSKTTVAFKANDFNPIVVQAINGLRPFAEWTLNFSQKEFDQKVIKTQVVLLDRERKTWNWTESKPLHQFIAIEMFEADSEDNLLVVVPGIGHRSGYWGDTSSKLRSFLKNYSIVEVIYVSGSKIRSIAYDLSRALEYLSKRYRKKPVVITHSMGGLITRAYIQGLAVDTNGTSVPYKNDIGGLLMLAPPNFGSELAARFSSRNLKLIGLVVELIGKHLLNQNRKAPAHQDMSPGSDFLWNLNYIFKGLPSNINPWVIAGNQHIRVLLPFHRESGKGQHDSVVAISSASLLGANPPVPISIVELNHLDQIKSSTNLIQEYLLRGSLQMAKFDQFPFGVLMVKVRRDHRGRVFLKRVSDGNTLELKRNRQSGIYYHLSVPTGKYLIHRDSDREVKEIEIESLKATLVEY